MVNPSAADDPGDPFRVLGLEPGASIEDVRAARRRLAKRLHPDRGGDAERMRDVNAAFDAAVARVNAPPAPADSGSPSAHGGDRAERRRRSGPRRAEWDPASFVIELPPADAFEALVVVASWIGEVLADEQPWVLEAHLIEPEPCWCRLELLPEGTSTSVSLLVAAVEDDQPAPSVVQVRDTWVAHLNQLARWEQ